MSAEWNQAHKNEEQILKEPYNYLAQYPGKEVRTLLMNAFDEWLQVPRETFKVIEDVVRMLHTSSLLIDDIQDNSKLRRGVPVAHKIYGIAQTINCANYVYFEALSMVCSLNEPRAVQVFTDELQELHRGQGMDIFYRDAPLCPTEEEYREMVKRKTGGLFRLAVKMMQLFSNDKRDYVNLLDILGLYFQIRDDYANVSSEKYMNNKSFCEDVTEGKFSFPIIHCISTSRSSNNQLLNILKQRTEDQDLKKHCQNIMKSTGSFEYCVSALKKLEKEALDEIELLGGNSSLQGLIYKLRQVYEVPDGNLI
eukprot:Nk52_evm14s294 gene=Nk52_evmTU14s294